MATPIRAIICPSMLSCDFARLAEEAQRMLNLGADWLHMDVMVRLFSSPLSPFPPCLFFFLKNEMLFINSIHAGHLSFFMLNLGRVNNYLSPSIWKVCDCK